MENGLGSTEKFNFGGTTPFNGIIGLVAVAVGVMIAFGRPAPGYHQQDLVLVGVAMGLLGMFLILITVLTRLSFTETEVAVRSIFTKRMDYNDIARIDWTTTRWGSRYASQRVATYVLVGRTDRRIKIVTRAYQNKHDWASRLLKLAEARQIPLDPKVRHDLEVASRPGYKQPLA